MPASLRFAVCAATLVGVSVLLSRLIHVNTTTAALILLLIVLGVATRWNIGEAIFTSIAAVFCLNYFFLPPVGTLSIEDPENWVALIVFLVAAIVTSQLSSRARQRAEEALAGRDEIQKLYDLSHTLLMNQDLDALDRSLVRARRILGASQVAFFELSAARVYGTLDESRISLADFRNAAHSTESVEHNGIHAIPVRLGNEPLGCLALDGCRLSPTVMDSVASLFAISYERSRALEKAAAAEVARRNEEFRSSLLDGLAHDLKTPLTAVRTCVTRLIAIPPKTEEVRQELLQIIDEESDRLQRSISAAIEVAALESGELRPDRRWTPLAEVARSAIEGFRDGPATRYSLEIPEDTKVFADPDLLRRALVHTLENAQRYSPPESPIRIEAHTLKGALEVHVLDEGPGFLAGETGRIFDKFFRGSHGKQYAGGTGMGLAIARGIIEAHGGAIRASNRASGGACVSIVLPAHG